ncbi:unnamed protein product [Ectocarpus sp. 4 AP-2014]|uniref:EsV-1-62 n=1 Tax=Ectocarpus siliculosus virus 1 (isolate New Zealand/Kaikoura/1988) TaxID=654926 RepID=Q8QNK9_ESV1K|nr:EsV-1-62 [Ectocarpus siliculosus virus 1]AAK14485.1 EsV-1-62 [Ectocarpus siliculosus virus 1]
MNCDDVTMPDFSSVLLGGDDPQRFGKKTATEIEDNERESEEELGDKSAIRTPSEPGPVPEYDSSSESETEHLYEPETEYEFPETPETPETPDSSDSSESSDSSDSSDSSESSESFEYESESDCDSDEESSSDDDSSNSRTSDVGECDEEERGTEHVYEQEADTDEEEEEAEEEEEGGGGFYDDTDLGGDTVDTASMIAASVVAGAGAVRSGTGWTWTSIFIVISAAGGVGIVLLYAIKRINELTRLVKTLEENSHMAINERDVQVITTQVIGDMLEDSDNSRDPIIDTPERDSTIETPQEVQTEFDNVVEGNQSVSELLQEDDKDETDNEGARAEQEPLAVPEIKHEKGHEASSPLVIVEKKHGSIVDVLKEPAKPSVAAEEERGITAVDKPVEQRVKEMEKDDPDDSIVDDLSTMVEAMSLSEDFIETEESSRLITGTKRVRTV